MSNRWIRWLHAIKKRKFEQKGVIYRKSLLIVLVITCLPAALIAVCFYMIGTKQIEYEVMRTHQLQLQKVRERIDEQLSHIEITASQWALNPLFDEKLKQIDLYRQFAYTHDIYKSLFIIKGSSTLIDQVYLYLDDKRTIVSEDEGIQLLTEEQIQPYNRFLQNKNSMFWIRAPVHNRQPSLLLVHTLPGDLGRRFGALIFVVNESKMNDIIREPTIDRQGSAFIVTETGQWMVYGQDANRQVSEFEVFIRDEVLKRQGKAESFIVKWKKENVSVSYGTFSKMRGNWVYITSFPFDELIAPVRLMSRMILFVSSAGIFAAILLTWLGSMRLYRPIHQLVELFRTSTSEKYGETKDELTFIERQWKHMAQESKTLQERIGEQLTALRGAFLLQLVQGHLYSFTEKELRDRMIRFGWDVENRCFSIMLVKLTGYFASQKKFSENDKQLMTFAAANIIGELGKCNMQFAEAINFQDLSIGLLVAFPEEKHWRHVKSELFKLADEITETLNTLLKLKVAICVGKTTDSVRDIPNVLQQVRQTMHYRVLEDNNQLLDIDEIVTHHVDPSYYPFHIEKEIHHAIRRGNESQVNVLIDDFFTDLGEQSVTEYTFMQSAQCLLGSILLTIVQIGFNPQQVYQGENLFEQLGKIRETDEIPPWFRMSVIRPYMKEFAETQDWRLKSLIQQAIEMIHANYMNDISLELCAEHLGVHPVRLSKAFKQVSGSTFIEYVTKIRMEKSKELLRTTNRKIREIALQVGYQPTYFNKIFRKYEGITASEYRNATRG